MMNNSLWIVWVDTKGAHEAECVYSIWSTKEGAKAEQARLTSTHIYGGGCYGDVFQIAEVALDKPSDTWLPEQELREVYI